MSFIFGDPDSITCVDNNVFYASFFPSDKVEGVYNSSGGIGLDVFVACINSLRAVNSSCSIVICINRSCYYVLEELCILGRWDNMHWLVLDNEKVHRRRATAKMEGLSILAAHLNDETRILVSDIDIYFLDDPFKALFEDIGLTTRGYPYWAPINGGIWYLKLSNETRAWLYWHMSEIFRPTWKPYVNLRSSRRHERHGLDWTVNQNFLICNWIEKQYIYDTFSILISDCGPEYNFCPAVDLVGLSKAKEQIRNAIISKSVHTIHLKSNLKSMIEDKQLFPLAPLKGTIDEDV